MIFDTHCHLDFEHFENDRAEVIKNASQIGVTNILTIGCHPKSFQKTLEIAKKSPYLFKNTPSISVFAALGIHPCDVTEEFEKDFELLEQKSQEKEVIAIGETGLDFYHEGNVSKKKQFDAFHRHIDLAQQQKKPIIIHLRNAREEALEFLESRHDFTFEVHCFCEDWNFAKKILDWGGYLGFGGILTFKNCTPELREVAKKCPLDRMLLETDAPFLAPMPHRGKRNEPAFTRHIAEFLADIREENFEEFCEQTTKNGKKLFGI